MSLWNNIKGWFDSEEKAPQPRKLAPTPKPTIEINESSVKEIFAEILNDAGVNPKHIERFDLIERFVLWYQGTANHADISAAIPDFKNEFPRINSSSIWKNL